MLGLALFPWEAHSQTSLLTSRSLACPALPHLLHSIRLGLSFSPRQLRLPALKEQEEEPTIEFVALQAGQTRAAL